MSSSWVPPRPTYHLRIFIICLVLVVACLVGFLFGVRLEAVVPAAGVLHSRHEQEIRGEIGGLVELGWYEAEITSTSGSQKTARLDPQGNGISNPHQGPVERIHEYRFPNGQEITPELVRFHKLQEGDLLWPGQTLGHIHAAKELEQLAKLQGRLQDLQSQGGTTREVQARLNYLREQLAKTTLLVPADGHPWQVLQIQVGPQAAVQPGQPLVLAVPLEAQTQQPRDLVVTVTIPEKNAGFMQSGQLVRLYSTMYNQRLYGHAEGVLERIGPLAEMGQQGERIVRAEVVGIQAPFPLKLGSSFKAEIVVGQKPVYNIILEH